MTSVFHQAICALSLRYHHGMTRLHLIAPEAETPKIRSLFSPLRVAGLTTALVGAVSLGVYIGLELRIRYRFHRRTPSDFFANAGDPLANAEYGMGI